MAFLFSLQSPESATGVAESFFIASASSTEIKQLVNPRFLSAVIKASTDLRILATPGSPYLPFKADRLVIRILSILAVIVGLLHIIANIIPQALFQRADDVCPTKYKRHHNNERFSGRTRKSTTDTSAARGPLAV